MKRTNLLLLTLFLCLGAVQHSNTALELEIPEGDSFIDMMDKIFEEHAERRDREIDADIAEFVDVTSESKQLAKFIKKSQDDKTVTRQMLTDWQTLAVILGGSTADGIDNYEARLAEAFDHVNVRPQREVWRQPLLTLLAAPVVDLNAVTHENFQSRIDTLKKVIRFYEDVTISERPTAYDIENFKICLTGLMIKGTKPKEFLLNLYDTLKKPLLNKNEEYTTYLEILSQITDGLERFLGNGGALTFDLYRAYCFGQRAFEEKLKNLQQAALQNGERAINAHTALRFSSSIATRLADEMDQAPEQKGWFESLQQKAQRAARKVQQYVMPDETKEERARADAYAESLEDEF